MPAASKTKATRTIKRPHMLKTDKSYKILLLSKSELTTKGLSSARAINHEGMLSIGIITSDKNRKMLPNETAPSVEVSSELKIYPTIIPTQEKKDTAKNKISKV